MVSVFNIEPRDIKFKILSDRYNFEFLKKLSEYGISPIPYYELLNGQEEFKFKNIYNFIFLRLIKINKKYPKINTIEKLNHNIDKEYFDDIFKGYIGDDIINTILIINSIQLYFFPKLTN